MAHSSTLHHPLPKLPVVGFLLALLIFPVVATWTGQDFYINFASRLLIFALAASSLNLILGFGGMVSLGHAAYFGAGAYTVAILASHDVSSAWLTWPLAILLSAVLAWLIGLASLRTRGVYFIMITLAFAQMTYYIFVSLDQYGGDDGLALYFRSSLGSWINLGNDTHFYYVVLVLCSTCTYFIYRLINSPFGRALQGIRDNETRMQAVGFPVFRYKLIAFVLAGALAGLAGALFANQSLLASPSQLHWMQSGILMVMVLLGGMGHLFGGLVGAFTLLILEEVLAAYTTHWPLVLGLFLLAVVLFLPNGLVSLVQRQTSRKDTTP